MKTVLCVVTVLVCSVQHADNTLKLYSHNCIVLTLPVYEARCECLRVE